MTDLPPLVLTNDTKFSDIIVPTIDNVRNAFLIEFLLKNDKTVLCIGPTGTGKTLTIVVLNLCIYYDEGRVSGVYRNLAFSVCDYRNRQFGGDWSSFIFNRLFRRTHFRG